TAYSFNRQFSCWIDWEQDNFISEIKHFSEPICQVSCSRVQMRLKNDGTFFLPEEGLCALDQCPQFFRVMSIIINKYNSIIFDAILKSFLDALETSHRCLDLIIFYFQ